MAEPSNKNPENLFHFTITPLTKFREAIEAFIDKDFNPTEIGVIEVFEEGVDFTARNVDTEVTGLLRLNSTALKDFQFNDKCKGKVMWVDFRVIHLNISNKYESITFYHFDGSDDIIVKLGDQKVKEFDWRILTIDPEFKRFFDIEFICEAEIPSNSLREMLVLLKMLKKDYQLVSVDISEKVVTVLIVDHLVPWIFDFNDVNQVGGTRGMEPGQNHQARFNWAHLEVLRKASHITPTFLISPMIQPKHMIMTRFSLGDLGDLVFIDKATTIIINSHSISLDGID